MPDIETLLGRTSDRNKTPQAGNQKIVDRNPNVNPQGTNPNLRLPDRNAKNADDQNVDDTSEGEKGDPTKLSQQQLKLLEGIYQKMSTPPQPQVNQNDQNVQRELLETMKSLRESQQKNNEEPPKPLYDPESGELNVDALTQTIAKTVDTLVEKRLSDALNPVMEKVSRSETLLKEQQVSKASNELQALQEKYGSIEPYKQTMLDIAQSNPSLSVEEIYLISRQRQGDPIVPQEVLDSEKPGNNVDRGHIDKGNEAPQGFSFEREGERKDLKTSLQEAYERLNA